MNQGQTFTAATALDEANRLATAGRHEEAITLLQSFAGESDWPTQAAVKLCYLLIGVGRPEEALAAITALAIAPEADLSVLTAHGAALKAAGRLEQAIGVYQRAIASSPASGVAEHNLAAALGDGHWFAECEAATSRALAKGLDAPETWLVRGRAFLGLGRHDDAERAFRQVLLRRPFSAETHTELAQLMWMRTEDSALAMRDIDAAIANAPAEAGLVRAKARLLGNVGDRDGAYGAFVDALARPGADPSLNADAALAACWIDGAPALAHAELAVTAAPQRGDALAALCQANLATDRPEPALEIAQALQRRWPNDQFIMALIGMGWRMLGDPLYREFWDYDRFVRSQPLATPNGWSSLEAYLSELAASLRSLHQLRGHPIGQSLRNGTQTAQCLSRSADPVIQAFFTAIDTPVRQYLASLGANGRVLGRPHAPGADYRLDKAWSVLLRPRGFHVDHLHPKGWISSACYIELPASVAHEPEGWLKFGQPGIPTRPALAPEHYVRPRPGHLVLFPSYMWHGTVPFSGEEARMSAALDVIPA
jgi:tetratricopeptide (TPR) repeat protein